MLQNLILAQADQGVTDAPAILQGAENGSKLAVQSFNADWQDLVNGTSPVYLAIVRFCVVGCGMLIAFWAIGWMREVTTNGLSWRIVDQLTWPVIVILMLSLGHGALLANTSLLFRGVSNYMNNQLLDITRNGVTLREAIRETSMEQALSQALKTKFQQCAGLSGVHTDPNTGAKTSQRTDCESREAAAAQQTAEDYRTRNQLPAYKFTWDPRELVGQVLNSAVQGLLYLIFSGLEAAFQYLVQLSFLLAAYTGPVFVSLSLLPVGSKPIYGWLSGWLSLGLVLNSYSIIVGIAASSIVNAQQTNPLFLPLIEGVLSPLLALGIGAGGGLILFNGFISTAAFLTRG